MSNTPLSVRLVLQEARRVTASTSRAFVIVWNANRWLALLNLLITAISSFFPIFTIWLTKLIFDWIQHVSQRSSIGTPVDMRPLWLLLILLAAVWIAQRGADAFASTLNNLLRFSVEQYSQTLIMRKCSELDIAFFEDPKNLNMLENASHGASASAWGLIWMLFSLLRNVITLGTFIIVLARLHWLVMVVVAVTTIPQVFASSYYARRRWEMYSNRAEDSRLRSYISWLITQRDPAKEIRIFSLAETLTERFRFFCRNFFLQEVRMERRYETTNFFLGFLSIGSAIGTWIYILLRAVAQTITYGDIALYTQAVGSCQGNLMSLFMQGGQLYEQTLSVSNLFALLDIKPEEIAGALRGPAGSSKRWGELPAPQKLQVGIEFRDVWFRYPGIEKWALRGVSFHLNPNESVAFVGRNGAGKTTLIKLLVRLYDPTKGDILLDGMNIREYDIESLRQLFGVIFQDYTRYCLTLRENIGFGDVRYIDDTHRIQQAAKMADTDRVAERLPQQYETYLARQFAGLGEDLSGGEWQKIALARAYMRDCPILILDEPTASLDAFAEYAIYQSFSNMTSNKMAILISHRFSTVRMVDRILVLDQGELQEEGSHENLMCLGGLYASMFTAQAERYR